MLTGTAGYVGALYKKNLQDYPETGKNLYRNKKEFEAKKKSK